MLAGSSEEELQKDLRAKLTVLGSEQQERLARRRAETLRLPYVALSAFPMDPDVLELVPRTQAATAQAVLFYRQGKDVRVGAVNPKLPALVELIKDIEQRLRTEAQIYVISHHSLTTALGRYRREQVQEIVPDNELRMEAAELDSFKKSLQTINDLGPHIAGVAPTSLLTTVMAGAISQEASDVHIEPGEESARLRYRIDGVLQDVAEFPRSGWQLLLSRVKVLTHLKLNVHDVPQDGSFVVNVQDEGADDVIYDIRVSVLPGGNGENLVFRILDRRAEAAKITDLGMKPRDFAAVTEELRRSDGMILVTGPTGSGKTTSLASFIQTINSTELKVITLEDPIEYRLPGVEQTQIDHEAGYTFAKGLRAILRQDPDVVMVGEIRDAETAETALHASLTGHLVFSTLHTNDAPGAVPRLVDLGAKSYIIAPAVNILIAQRLVRLVCDKCAEEYVADATLRQRLLGLMRGVVREVFDPAAKRDWRLRRAKGCSECHGTGYRGRVGIFEVMPVRGQVEELILAGADSNKLRIAAQTAGMTTIVQDGVLKVLEKMTTIEEVERVTGE